MLVTLVGYAQDSNELSPYIDHYSNIIPETPNAASFSIYGNTPVNYSTGIPNISIPIYTVQVDGVQVPISISYHAGGVKVDDLASVVGLKWTLNTGGGIFRSVNGGLADEKGWLLSEMSYLEDSYYASHSLYERTTQDDLKRSRDHDPDRFNYTFPGGSGNFIFKPKTGLNDVSVIKEIEDNIVISPVLKTTLPYDLTGFSTRDTQGNQFNFATREFNDNTSVTAGTLGPYVNSSTSTSEATSWMLDDITTKNNYKINFSYTAYKSEYQINQISQRIKVYKYLPSIDVYHGKQCGAVATNQTNDKQSTSVLYKPTNQLIELIETNTVEIQFIYSEDANLSDWKKQLDKIIIRDKIKNKEKEFRFVYGKFSGDPRLKLKELHEVGFDGEQKPAYVFTYNETPLPVKGSFAKDHWGYYNGKSNRSLIPYTTTAVNDYYLTGKLDQNHRDNLADKAVYTSFAKAGVLTKIQYPTGGSSEFVFESNETSDETPIKQGGLRIQEKKDLDENGKEYNKVLYEYSGFFGSGFHEYLTHKPLDKAYVFSSEMCIDDPMLYRPGYYYEKVTVKQLKNESDFITSEYHFSDNSTISSISSSPLETNLFKGNTIVKQMKYDYANTITNTTYWNQLGELDFCYITGVSSSALGHGEPINTYYQTKKRFLSKEATTDFESLADGSELKPSTTIKQYIYNDDLLVVEEKTEKRLNKYFLSVVDAIKFGEDDDYDANGEYYSVKTTYPKEYTNNSQLQNLVAKNIVSLPISKIVFNKQKQIQGQFFTYDTNGNIKEAYRYNKGMGSNSSSENYIPTNYDLHVTYTNIEGKPIEVKQENGISTSYVWDITNTYVLAKIENATYAEVTPFISDNLDLTLSDSVLKTSLDAIRNGLPNALVSTFTYYPLIGVASVTDPRGKTIYYNYDGLGRLIMIKDNEQKVLKENKYYYKN